MDYQYNDKNRKETKDVKPEMTIVDLHMDDKRGVRSELGRERMTQ